MPGRAWTPDEEQLVRENYRSRGAKWLSKQLGRSLKSIYLKAVAIGAAAGRRDPAELHAFIRSEHAAGRMDRQIAEAWSALHPDYPLTRRDITYHRNRLGLAVQAEAILESRRAAQRRQCERLGITGPRDLWRRAFQRRARRAGWPEANCPRELTLLLLMADGEPRTRAEIAAAIGERQTNQRWWFKQRSGSTLTNLVNRRLLRRTRGRMRRVVGQGKGRSQYEYRMPLEVRMRKGLVAGFKRGA